MAVSIFSKYQSFQVFTTKCNCDFVCSPTQEVSFTEDGIVYHCLGIAGAGESQRASQPQIFYETTDTSSQSEQVYKSKDDKGYS